MSQNPGDDPGLNSNGVFNSNSNSQSTSSNPQNIPVTGTRGGREMSMSPIQTFESINQMQLYKLAVENAQSYLDQVKYKLGSQSQDYKDILCILEEHRKGRMSMSDAIQRVSNLLRGYPELIVGFNTFLPPEYHVEVQPNEQPPPSS